ncbi:unnamed protein product [Moneuplotes crassus]|uniref:Thioredoxin domain-containing protein n=1 Tax=Euplotes crassus TaxID=5936 RepID=A0AAD2D811_EUPCR|nr:unnamed protein product [Moneuplotes crassus]
MLGSFLTKYRGSSKTLGMLTRKALYNTRTSQFSNLSVFQIRTFASRNRRANKALSKEEVWKQFQKKKEIQKAKHDPTDISKFKYKEQKQEVNEYFTGTPLNSFKNIYKDNTTKGLVNILIAFIICMGTSKYLAEYIFTTKWDQSKSPDSLELVKPINPDTLSLFKNTFIRQCRYFVQIIREPTSPEIINEISRKISSKQELTDEEKTILQNEVNSAKVHPDFKVYNKVCKDMPTHEHSLPFSIVKLELDKFDSSNKSHKKLFERHFGNYTIEELRNSDAPYMIIDEFGNKLALPAEEIDIELYKRFLKGPLSFPNHNKLFEYMEANKRTNKHYFIIPVKKMGAFSKKFSPRLKIFRKFFTENSGYFHPQVEFIEVYDFLSKYRLGLKDEEVVYHFTNDLDQISCQGEKSEFYTLKLIKNMHHLSTEEGLKAKYGKDLPAKENIVDYAYKNHRNEMFQDLAQFVESFICDSQNIIYSCDQNMLSFYANHFSKRGDLVLVVYLDRNKLLDEMKADEYRDKLLDFIQTLNEFKKNNKDYEAMKIIISDSDNALLAFKILSKSDSTIELRLHSYDTFLNLQNASLVSRYDQDVNQKIEDPDAFTFLKLGKSISQSLKEDSSQIYSSISNFIHESVGEIEDAISKGKIEKPKACYENRDDDPKYKDSIIQPLSFDYEKQLKTSKRYSIIKLYSDSCKGCKYIEKAYEQLAGRHPDIKFYELNALSLDYFSNSKNTSLGETPFRRTAKIPSFVIYDKKQNKFSQIEFRPYHFTDVQKSEKSKALELKTNVLDKMIQEYIQ